MDDLKKLLENAGITEMDVLNPDVSNTLGMRMIARFDNFNAMIEAAIKNQ